MRSVKNWNARLPLALRIVVAGAVCLLGPGGSAGAALSHRAAAGMGMASSANGSGYILAPVMMGGGADQPGALPNATFTLNLGGEGATYDPQVESTDNELTISALVFAPLLAINQHKEVAANAATSMVVSPDGRTYTFTIRRGMTYSDGKPVDAQDYAYAIRRACDPAVNGEYSNILFAVVGCQAWRTADSTKLPAEQLQRLQNAVSTAIAALDANTLRIQLLHPAGYFPYVMATWVTYPSRRDLVRAGGANWWKNPASYIGNGPFKVVSWTPNQQWVLARNDHYFRGKPGIATLTFKEINNSSTELLAYRQGQFDIAGVDPALLPSVLHNPALAAQLHRRISADTSYMAFNSADPPFNNVKVRQAFSYALNRRQYIRQILNGVSLPAGTFLYPGIAGYQQRFQQTYDPAQARRLLAQAGYANGQGFPALPLRYSSDNPAGAQDATYFAAQLKQVLNVSLVPTPVDRAQIVSMVFTHSPDLKIYFRIWYEDYPHPQDWLSLVFGNGSRLGPRGWNDAHFNALVNRADTLPIDAATPLYQQADAYLAEQAPVAFLLHGEDLLLIPPTVKGYAGGVVDLRYQSEKLYKTK